jgi:predicted DsbA family dithiol-disulfide isomerase
MEFPQLASSYAVRGVPHVVINENYSFMGLKTESELMDYIEEAVATPCPVQRYQTA